MGDGTETGSCIPSRTDRCMNLEMLGQHAQDLNRLNQAGSHTKKGTQTQGPAPICDCCLLAKGKSVFSDGVHGVLSTIFQGRTHDRSRSSWLTQNQLHFFYLF